MSESPVILELRATGEVVGATLVEDVPLDHLAEVDRLWKPEMDRLIQERKDQGAKDEDLPQYAHWRWDNKAKYARVFPLQYRFFGIRVEGETQGLLMTAISTSSDKLGRIESQRGKPLVYVDYLQVAPWNEPKLTDAPRYKGTGSVLIAAAIQQSRDEGFQGRIGLHALSDVEGWYRKHCGMTELGPDPDYLGLKYYEMTPEQAKDFYPGG